MSQLEIATSIKLLMTTNAYTTSFEKGKHEILRYFLPSFPEELDAHQERIAAASARMSYSMGEDAAGHTAMSKIRHTYTEER